MREYELQDDWESDWESSDGQEVTVVRTKKFKKLMKGSDVNPAVAYMLEHSGLSQEEILCIIEQSKKKSDESKDNKRSKTPDIVIKTEPPDENIDEDVTESLDDAENVVSPKSDRSEQDFVAVEDTNGDIHTEKSTDDEVKETRVPAMSDSESDDFVEVEDVPTTIVDFFTKKDQKPALEIAIAPETTLEDDMFADVFADTDVKMPFVDTEEDIKVQEPLKISTKSETATVPHVEESRTSVENEAKVFEDKIEQDRKEQPVVVIDDAKESVVLEAGTSGRENPDDRKTVVNIDEEKKDDEENEKKNDDEKQEKKKEAVTQENKKEKEVLKLPVLREDLLSMQVSFILW